MCKSWRNIELHARTKEIKIWWKKKKKKILERACSQTEELIKIKKVEVDNTTAQDQEFIRLRQEKFKLERAKQEMEIIMMDISSLDPQQQHYICQLHLEIIESQTKST